MGQTVELTPRDDEILRMLTHHVRVATVAQIARGWFGQARDPVRAARRRLTALAAARFVRRVDHLARPLPALDGPLVAWRPGNPPSNFTALATRLAARWNVPLAPTALVVATRMAGVRLGGSGGRLPRLSEVSHDIALAEVYFRRFRTLDDPATIWHSEAQLVRLGFGDRQRLPDAMIERSGVRTVIEVGGAYSAAKLSAFHAFCAAESLPYEIW